MKAGSRPDSILIVAGQPRSLLNFRGPLLRAMRAEGHVVAAAAPGINGDGRTATQLEEMGIACHDIPLNRTGMNPLADLRLLASLARLMRRERPDVVFAYTIKAVIFGLIAASIARVPRRFALITGVGYVFTGTATGKRRLARILSQSLYRLSLRHADKLIFQNPDDLDLFRRLALFPSRVPAIVVNGSGIDVEQFRPAPAQSGPLRFLLIARLLSAKGIREYAAAAAMVREKWPNVEFHLVGGFDSNPDAIPPPEVEAWQRDGTLIWHGEVDDVRPLIANAHVYVLPSYREGTPRSVLEAMAMGRPIITTDAPGCRETVVDGVNGFLVPPCTVEPIARAMERFVTEPGLVEQMGAQSLALAKSKYDVRLVNDRMLRAMELA
jgi:glycosyltransferase involved in cell wall biosynthesis